MGLIVVEVLFNTGENALAVVYFAKDLRSRQKEV
jgi:hypothetical protein